jgi:hypothetical protein
MHYVNLFFLLLIHNILFSYILLTIVLRPGLIQGPGSGFWRDHRIGWVNSFFLKSKRRRFSKKNKKDKSQ